MLDPKSGNDLVEIYDNESRVVKLHLGPALNGEVITSVVSVTATSRGLVVGSGALTLGGATTDGEAVQVLCSTPTAGEEYDVEVVTDTQSGERVVGKFVVRGIT